MKGARIKKIYKAGSTLGAVLQLDDGKRVSRLVNRSELLALFVKQNFPKINKNKVEKRIYLYEKRGLKDGLHVIGYIDTRRGIYHAFKTHELAHEMCKIFRLDIELE